MKIISIGSDRNLFKKDSEIQKRIKEYGKLFEELHVIVFSDKKDGHSDMKLSDNVFIYPTNHSYKAFYLWNIYGIIKNLKLRIENSRNDFIVSCQDPFEAGLAGWLLKLWLNLPLQLQVHTDFLSPYFSSESALNRFRVRLAKFLLLRADRIRVVSERIKSSLLTLDSRLPACPARGQGLSTKIAVLPVFVDIKKIQSAKIKTDLHRKYSDNDFIILMASRLAKEKNIGMAIDAMPEMVENHPKALLLIVGSGPEDDRLKFQAEKYGILDSNIRFEPWTDDLVSYYKTADLLLLTSNYEGYGRTVIEAMAAGLPVVMTDVGLAGEVLIDDLDGSVIPVGDKESLSGKLIELIGDLEKREGFIKNSLKAVESLLGKNEYLDAYKRI